MTDQSPALETPKPAAWMTPLAARAKRAASPNRRSLTCSVPAGLAGAPCDKVGLGENVLVEPDRASS